MAKHRVSPVQQLKDLQAEVERLDLALSLEIQNNRDATRLIASLRRKIELLENPNVIESSTTGP